jgi:hypothetical protein
MKLTRSVLPFAVVLLAGLVALARSDEGKWGVKEKAFDAPNGVKVKLRMEGPYTADVPLQVVCYFKYTPEGAKRMSGSPVELDKKLGGVIASLRERGEFVGELGKEDALSLEVMERVGKVTVREAVRLGVRRVAFAPMLRDQGNTKLPAGDVETAVVRGMLLAYDTEKRLQKEGLTKAFTLDELEVEAGAKYFDDTLPGVQKAIEQAEKAIKDRGGKPYSKGK